jgi:Xaa-Pro aminopeptidase
MKDGEPGTPTQSEWLNSNFTTSARIGVDDKTYPKSLWDKMKAELRTGLVLEGTTTNLVNEAWGALRPACPNLPVHSLPIEYSGKTTAAKLADVRKALTDEKADALVVSELEEVAWLLNLRGRDLPHASVFFGFVIVGSNFLDIFMDETKFTVAADKAALVALSATFHPYASLDAKLTELEGREDIKKIWISKYASAALANLAKEKQLIKLTPIIHQKALKNPVEVQGMRDAHLKDSAAIVSFLSWLEIQLNTAGAAAVSEISGAAKLESIRAKGEKFVAQSFTTISGFGPNGAVIHYRPTPATNLNITKNGLYLLDSGGLYWDGTTDITRTLHFGTPTAEQKDRFTRVLKGHIVIATAVFPNKLPGHRLDSFARKALWDAKLDYKHGTGHGIGHYLNVHEGPQKISFYPYVDDSGLEENMFVSNEPGYYKDGEYGIRLENIVRIAKSSEEGWLQIETVSFVPIQTKLIDLDLLTAEEIKWVNDYNKECREKVLAHMKANPGNEFFGAEAQAYLTKETNPISTSTDSSAPFSVMASYQFVLITSILSFIMRFILPN